MVTKRRLWIIALAAAALLLLAACPAGAEEAENLTSSCEIQLCVKSKPAIERITDGKYTSYWESEKMEHPWVTISSEQPLYGLYLCFQLMPERYEIQKQTSGGQWETVLEGDTRYHHMFYELDGYQHIRIYASGEKKTVMGFNEIFVFGAGDVPEWVQRWQPTPEKADMLFLVAHPDDDLLFLGGVITWYGVVQKKSVTVVYLTKSNTTRRSEALNGLWTLGIRTYPVFGPFRDHYAQSGKVKDAYKDLGGKSKVQAWVTELFRRLKPEVAVTQDQNGEYGHPQHKMLADACMAAFDLAADPASFPDSTAHGK